MAQCRAKTRKGDRCKRDAVDGADFCTIPAHAPAEPEKAKPAKKAKPRKRTRTSKKSDAAKRVPSARRLRGPLYVTIKGGQVDGERADCGDQRVQASVRRSELANGWVRVFGEHGAPVVVSVVRRGRHGGGFDVLFDGVALTPRHAFAKKRAEKILAALRGTV